MTLLQPSLLRVVIVGGGFSGASLAWQLADRHAPVQITVVEPRAELGRGLAYSSDDPTHRVNVPAHRMTMDPDHREDFLDWLTAAEASGRLIHDRQSVTAQGERFPRRAVFGRYVTERLAPYLENGRIRHRRARVSDLEKTAEGGFWLLLSDDSRVRADILVLATGHPAPALPGPVAALNATPQLIADPGDAGRLAAIDKDAPVLIFGAGLGAADVIATLDRLGHRGKITCLSRRGLRSRGHGLVTQDSQADFTDPPIRLASELLRQVRHAVVDDLAQGQSWHATFHRLRAQGAQIWAALDDANRARLLRHLRVFWDVHRYRLAPQVEAVIAARIATGQLEYLAGHLVSAELHAGNARIGWRPRGTREVLHTDFAAVINTTGPAQGRCIAANPVLGALARLGQIAPDPLGLGLATTPDCHARDALGQSNPQILVAGPLARGRFGELVGAPECAVQVGTIASEIARRASLALILRPAASAGQVAASPN